MRSIAGCVLILGALGGCGSSTQAEIAALPGPVAEPVVDLRFYVSASPSDAPGDGSVQRPFRDLQQAVLDVPDGATLVVMTGTHQLTATSFVDHSCANCDDEGFRTEIEATRGLWIHGKSLHIEGQSRTESIILTGAGYGLFFEDAGNSSLRMLTVSGGKRDADGRASNGAIVVRDSSVDIDMVDVLDNDDRYMGDPDPIVGVAGIVAREGAHIKIRDSRVLNASWDGIAAYRGDPERPGTAPSLDINRVQVGCTRDCITKSAGRGVGIGVTWGAQAIIRNTEVHDYWKGVGSFGTSKVRLENSIIHHQWGWGVVATANSEMHAINNVVASNGTLGMAVWDEHASGSFVNNIIVDNGWNPKEWVGKKTGLWLNRPDFDLRHNLFWNNQPFDSCSGGTPEELPCTPISVVGSRGNLHTEPRFRDQGFVPEAARTIDSGDSSILDVDGSPSDLGAYGGPASEWPRHGGPIRKDSALPTLPSAP